MNEEKSKPRVASERTVVWPNSLKGCPFCGTSEHVSTHHNGLDLWSVSCCRCAVTMEIPGGGFFTEGEAVISWNQRITKP